LLELVTLGGHCLCVVKQTLMGSLSSCVLFRESIEIRIILSTVDSTLSASEAALPRTSLSAAIRANSPPSSWKGPSCTVVALAAFFSQSFGQKGRACDRKYQARRHTIPSQEEMNAFTVQTRHEWQREGICHVDRPQVGGTLTR